MGLAYYADTEPEEFEPFQVKFIDNKSNKCLIRGFPSPFLAERFANKVRHSKDLTFVSYINYC